MVQCAFPWQVNWDRIKLVPDKIKFKPYYPDEQVPTHLTSFARYFLISPLQVERFVPVHLVGMEDNEYLKVSRLSPAHDKLACPAASEPPTTSVLRSASFFLFVVVLCSAARGSTHRIRT